MRAHIVPAAFGRLAIGAGKYLRTISREGGKPTYTGYWDPDLLCATCDGVLWNYDKYGIEFVKMFNKTSVNTGEEYIVDDVDTGLLSRFIISVLWRASITSRREFSEIRLGPYEPKFRRTLFAEIGGDEPLPAEIMLFRYQSVKFHIEEFYTVPIWSTINGINCYFMALGGFRVVAKVDKRKFPAIYDQYIINGQPFVRGLYLDFEQTEECRAMADVVADRVRMVRVRTIK